MPQASKERYDNVILLPRKRTPWTLDVLSATPVNGMVLIEGCIPQHALDFLLTYLQRL